MAGRGLRSFKMLKNIGYLDVYIYDEIYVSLIRRHFSSSIACLKALPKENFSFLLEMKGMWSELAEVQGA